MIIIVDNSTDAYTILPMEYVQEKYKGNFDTSNIALDEEVLKVEKKSMNLIRYNSISEQTMCMRYLGNYIYKIKTDLKKAYEELDEEYREKRFKTYEEFAKYINEDYDILSNATLKEYQVSNIVDNNVITYICKDQYGNYYIFKATAVMSYKVYLDNHTIDLPQFVTKYEQSKNENKVALNIEKIKDAINTKDYQYVYDKLDDTFKKNNYETVEILKKYLQENIYEVNKFDYSSVKEQSGLYVAKIIISDNGGNATSIRNMNIVMQLKEGTDFVMSFSIEK